MDINIVVLLLSALIPLAVGSVYYGPLLGKSWMSVNGFTEESLKGGNMAVIMGLSFLFSFFIAFALSGIVIHQMAMIQLLGTLMDGGDVNAKETFDGFMATYGDMHRTFGHGALHGGFVTIVFVFPIIAINALFERRGWKYIGIHTGYWFITLCLMGGVICQYF